MAATRRLRRPPANPEPEASLRGAAVYALEKLAMPFPALKLGKPIRAQAKIARIYLCGEREKQTALEARLATAGHGRPRRGPSHDK